MKEVQRVRERIYIETEFLKVIYYFTKDRATPIFEIFNKNSNDLIAEIKWFARWRKYCFYPFEKTVWDNKCLTDINNLLQKINRESELFKVL